MAASTADRIAQARERLTTALITGEDTTPHRQALEALEATHEAEEAKRREAIEQASRDRMDGITAAAHLLADRAWTETTASVAALAIPTRPTALDLETP